MTALVAHEGSSRAAGSTGLWGVVMTAYVHGTSTREVDDLVRAVGCDSGVSKSTVSRICAEIDAEVETFRRRRLDHTTFPYVFCDATYVKARVDGRVVSRAVVVATGVAADGGREVLGVDVGVERVNKEIKRRSNVVGIFPNDAAVLRLVGAVLLEVHDEWQVADRAYFSEQSMAQLNRISDHDATKEVTTDSHAALPAA